MKKEAFRDYVKDILAPFGAITIRAMFGGYGIYDEACMFALIANNELYFKADPQARLYFQEFESEPFVYYSKGRPVALSYWKVPPDILENHDELSKWIEFATQAARHAKKN